jgi:hypothetical protein
VAAVALLGALAAFVVLSVHEDSSLSEAITRYIANYRQR